MPPARHRLVPPLLLGLWLLAGGSLSGANADALQLLAQPGHVLLMRHANAPGVGDPSGMKLADCTTQRNLDARGRAQAERLGVRLRAAGISDVRVLTSQWCRCRDTARLLAIGPVEDLPALNSFFEEPETKAGRIAALREFLDKIPRDGSAVVLVTHQVTVTALTGYFPASGEGLVLQLKPGGGFERVAELADED
jgi:phosphohistidine phosphatase SixA